MASRPLQRSEQRAPQRNFVLRTGSNRFEIDPAKIPEDMDYGWKRASIFGQEDMENMINCEENDWVPVPSERHPELSGRRAAVGSAIKRGGLLLMERPKQISEEARELDTFAARHQVAAQVQRLGLEGKRAAGKGIKTRYEAPDDASAIPD